jgi:hypothetical protein
MVLALLLLEESDPGIHCLGDVQPRAPPASTVTARLGRGG